MQNFRSPELGGPFAAQNYGEAADLAVDATINNILKEKDARKIIEKIETKDKLRKDIERRTEELRKQLGIEQSPPEDQYRQ